MKRRMIQMFFAAALLLPGGVALSQEKPPQEKAVQEKPTKEEPQTAHTQPEGTQLRVQLVFAEFDGDKKVKSLPYTLLVRAEFPGKDPERSKIRMRTEGPIYSGTNTAPSQHANVMTNVDCYARQTGGGAYRVTVNLIRFWAEGEALLSVEKTGTATTSEKPELASRAPVTRQFESESTVTIRDGQTLETNVATDPVTGKVIRLDVTVTALK